MLENLAELQSLKVINYYTVTGYELLCTQIQWGYDLSYRGADNKHLPVREMRKQSCFLSLQ